ncbi:hypothetical protein PIB30_095886, partial [Stylosanthes scabra]|nr:hypothetical protein [Stylosanthes scabra]
IYKFVYKTDISSSLPFPSIIAGLCADAKIPAIPDDTLIPQEPPIVAEEWKEQESGEQRNRDKQRLLNNNHKSNINKNFLQISTFILTPPCPKSIGNLTNNKKRI